MARFSGESSKEGADGGQNGTGMEANAAPLPVTWQFEDGGEGEVSPSCAPSPSLEPATARGGLQGVSPTLLVLCLRRALCPPRERFGREFPV